MLSGVSADYYYGNSGSSIDAETGFSIPQYDSQEEIVTRLVAPFLLITILLQIAFQRALSFAFVDNDNGPTLRQLIVDEDPPSVKKESTVMALAVSGMLVPSPFFQYINDFVAFLFGGSIYILGAVAGIYFVYKLVTSFW
jgi:hypothetical protein